MPDKSWNILQPPFELVRQLSVSLDVSRTLAIILANRGIGSPEEADLFLNPSLDRLYDPYLMKGMEEAVAILCRALAAKEPILVCGDYDVDGVTGTALLVGLLRRFSDRVSYCIPHRVTEGYGLQSERIRDFSRQGGKLVHFSRQGGKLVLTVDCGISDIVEVEEGQAIGLSFIITDHHQPPEVLPPAEAIINPRQPGCAYPFKELAGVGIAFKLAQAMADRLGPGDEHGDAAGERAAYDFLDLVALGTVADIVPLRDENRILVAHGLRRLNSRPRVGVKALKEAAGIGSHQLTTSHISFALGPRINAAGRIGKADSAVDLLMEHRTDRASELAAWLNDENRRRQSIESGILREALEMLDGDPTLLDDDFLVLSSPSWHPGVIGIVASRLAERYGKPSILISTERDPGKGSARSTPDCDLFSSLLKCRYLLEAFGGHSYAAGLSIKPEKIAVLRRELNSLEAPSGKETKDRSAVEIDAQVGFDDLRTPFLKELRRLMPFGQANPNPVFAVEHVFLSRAPWTVGNNHLRLSLSQKPFTRQAIGYHMGDLAESLSTQFSFHVAFSLDLDSRPAGRGSQLCLRDIRFPYAFEAPHARAR
jgi:single-stranded-DNA-specific exonuclease